MPTYSITLTDAHVAKLQILTAEYNASHGTTLTVMQWVKQTLKDLAIERDILDYFNDRQSELDLTARTQLQTDVAAYKATLEATL